MISPVDTYFTSLSAEQLEKFEALGPLYSEWNQKINVISRKDIESLYEKHVLHSLAIAKFLPFKDETLVLDIGTGGGFPGIPLAIFFPGVKFTLVDSIGKKIQVVQAVAEALGLKNVTAIHGRAESIKGDFDFVISRAVAPMTELAQWSRGKLIKGGFNYKSNGFIFLKGGDLDNEIKDFKKENPKFHTTVKDLNDYFTETFFETKKIVYAAYK